MPYEDSIELTPTTPPPPPLPQTITHTDAAHILQKKKTQKSQTQWHEAARHNSVETRSIEEQNKNNSEHKRPVAFI